MDIRYVVKAGRRWKWLRIMLTADLVIRCFGSSGYTSNVTDKKKSKVTVCHLNMKLLGGGDTQAHRHIPYSYACFSHLLLFPSP